MDCSPPGFSVHRISQARILEWVSIYSSRGSSQPRDQTRISCVSGDGFFTTEPPGKSIYVYIQVCVYVYIYTYACIIINFTYVYIQMLGHHAHREIYKSTEKGHITKSEKLEAASLGRINMLSYILKDIHKILFSHV